MNVNYYDSFVRQGRAVSFTDDQIDFLADWLNISDGTEETQLQDKQKEIER